jgi:hypothetical protein
MAKYLAVHPMGKDLTIEKAKPIAEAVKANLTTDAYWIKSWYAREEGKLYCEWDAKDADSVQQVFHKTPELPVEGVYKLEMLINSEDFR